jgi:hypothetical protein
MPITKYMDPLCKVCCAKWVTSYLSERAGTVGGKPQALRSL